MNSYKFYYFIDTLDVKILKKIKKNIIIIYRNYYQDPVAEELIKFKTYCQKNKIKFLISNNIKIVQNLNLDGIYIPAFNKKMLNYRNILPLNKLIIGSAHNINEIKIKEFQGVSNIFLSPIFKTSKNKKFLDIIKFNNLSKLTFKSVVALGGINKGNYKKIKMTNATGLAGITNILDVLKNA